MKNETFLIDKQEQSEKHKKNGKTKNIFLSMIYIRIFHSMKLTKKRIMIKRKYSEKRKTMTHDSDHFGSYNMILNFFFFQYKTIERHR